MGFDKHSRYVFHQDESKLHHCDRLQPQCPGTCGFPSCRHRDVGVTYQATENVIHTVVDVHFFFFCWPFFFPERTGFLFPRDVLHNESYIKKNV